MSDDTKQYITDQRICPNCGSPDGCMCYGDYDDYDDDDDMLDFDDDPNRCPDCGGDIDAEGFCTMIECGYSIDFDGDDESEPQP